MNLLKDLHIYTLFYTSAVSQMQCKKIVADVGHINEKKSVKIKKNMYSKKNISSYMPRL